MLTRAARQVREDGLPADEARDIAVIGLACRFPGAADPQSFQRILAAGINTVRVVPRDRWDAERYYNSQPGQPGKSCSRWGAFLDDVAGFDAGFFRISPREAKSIDPQHRLLLETACEALESAGQPLEQLEGSRTGVFVGICGSEYATLSGSADDFSLLDKYFGTGTALSVAAGRIAYTLNLNGPTLSIETACSSSLVALHLAVGSLRVGESDLCIVGGVNVALSPVVGVYFSQLGAVSPSPECRPFDAEADGYVRGEGCGLVLLKRLDDALRHGDHIHAIIKGSAINQDGRSAGLTAPNGAAQEALIRAALADGRIDPAQVGYVETHGTGTRLGDPIEAGALGRVYGKAEGRTNPLLLGAVKANIGHLEAAAGIAGFIKAVIAVRDRRIPPQINLRKRNPLIAWEDLRLDIVTSGAAWPQGPHAPAYAAVSSFGFSGTNAHVIIAAPPMVHERCGLSPLPDTLILPVSARSPEALRELARELAAELAMQDDASAQQVIARCRGMALRRAHHPLRLCAVGTTPKALADDLGAQIAAWEPTRRREAPGTGPALVFSGQGSHWAGAGKAISVFPVARDCLDEIDALVRAQAGWSVRAVMDQPGQAEEPEIDIAQVCVFAAQMALFRLWDSLSVRPAAVVGHSMGEIAAACAAGILSLKDATRLSICRSLLLKRVAGAGLMAIVELGQEAAAEAITRSGLPVWIAGTNSPASTVISGETAAVRSLLAIFESERIFCRALRTGGVAGHSPLVAPLGGDLVAATQGLLPCAGTMTFVSTVDGEIKSGCDLGPTYWERNLVAPVRFTDALGKLLQLGCRDFVEISPKPILVPWIRQTLRMQQVEGSAIGVLQPDHQPAECLARVWGSLYAAGHALDWSRIYPGESAWSAPPAYPWMRERHWITDLSSQSPRLGAVLRDGESDNQRVLESLLRAFDNEGLWSVNMHRLAPLRLLTPDRNSAFYLARIGATCLAWAYLGPPERFEDDVTWLSEACAAREIALCLLVDDAGAEALIRMARDAWVASFAGTTHRIEPLSGFDLAAPGMRRLRGQLRRFAADGGGVTEEYHPGADPQDDAAAVALVDGWMALKRRKIPAAQEVKAELRGERRSPQRRFFATRRGTRLLALFVLTRFATGSGYLLDLEFYDEQTPVGCTEGATVAVIARLAAEGARILSLGGSYCAAPSADARTEGAVARQARYKRKFGAAETTLTLVHPPAMSPEQRDDLIRLMSGAAHDGQTSSVAGTPDALAPDGSGHNGSALPAAADCAAVHPLLGRRLSLAGETIVYESELTAACDLARQHVVHGHPVLPGAAYIEMAVASVWPYRRGRDIVLRDFVFERPLQLATGGAARLQVALALQDGEPTRYAIHVANDTRPETWSRLASGRVGFGKSTLATRDPLVMQSGVMMRPVAAGSLYETLAQTGIEYGPLFRGLGAIATDGERVVAEVALNAAARASAADDYRIHPAVLDAAMQSFAAVGDTASGALMIQSVEEIRVQAAVNAADPVAVLATIRAGNNDEGACGDLTISDRDGQILLEARGLIARRSRPEPRRDGVAGARPIGYATLRFADRAPGAGRGKFGGSLIVAGGEEDLAQPLIESLGARGARCRRIPGAPAAVLAGLAALDAAAWADAARLVLLPEKELPAAPADVGARLAALPGFARLLAERAGAQLRVWLVTWNATGSKPTPASFAEAALWGIGSVLRSEHPEWWGGVCDLQPQPVAAAAQALAGIIADPGAEDAWMVESGAPRVARVAEHSPPAGPPLVIANDCGYVVTGWSGGIGRRIVSWLLEQGAGRLALLARRSPHPALVGEVTAAAQRTGATLAFQVGDAADPMVTRAALADAAAGGVRVGGVFHAAGALGDGLLINQQGANFEEAFAGKVKGAWNLHLQTRDLDLDAFVLFSSSATLFGPPAQGPHVAASAAMDRVAALRRAEGLNAMSIGWGPWRGIGKAAELGLDARLARDGILPIEPDAAMQTMAALVGTNLAHAYVSPVDWARWCAVSPSLASRSLFPGAAAAEPRPTASGSRATASTDLEELCAQLCACIAKTLLCRPGAIDRTRSLEKNGLDSIMIVELRERIRDELGQSLALIDFFRAPSIDVLAARLLAQTGTEAGGRAA